jgi:anti-anti-sigma regulatory factor
MMTTRLYVGNLNGGSFLLTCPPKPTPAGVAGWCNHEVLIGLPGNSEDLANRLASAWNAIIDGQLVRPSFVSRYSDDLSSDVYGIHVIVASGDWTHEAADSLARKDIQDFLRITRDEEHAQRARRRAELGLEAARKLLLLDLTTVSRVSSWGEVALQSFIHDSLDLGYRVAVLPSTKNLAQLTGLKIILKCSLHVAFAEGSSRRAALWLYGRPGWENAP